MNIDNDLINGVVFIDLKKAFDDTIDHQIILQKLKNYGIDENQIIRGFGGQVVSALAFHLCGRRFKSQ
jgi:hypothetical protein